MFLRLKNNLGRIINVALIALLVVNIIELIVIKSLGTQIIPILHVEKVYMVVIRIILYGFMVAWLLMLIINKKFLVIKPILFVVFWIPVLFLWRDEDTSVLTIHNQSRAEINNIQITDAYETYTINSMTEGKVISIPIKLYEETMLAIKGEIGSGKRIDYRKEIFGGWYLRKEIKATINSSGEVKYKETQIH